MKLPPLLLQSPQLSLYRHHLFTKLWGAWVTAAPPACHIFIYCKWRVSLFLSCRRVSDLLCSAAFLMFWPRLAKQQLKLEVTIITESSSSSQQAAGSHCTLPHVRMSSPVTPEDLTHLSQLVRLKEPVSQDNSGVKQQCFTECVCVRRTTVTARTWRCGANWTSRPPERWRRRSQEAFSSLLCSPWVPLICRFHKARQTGSPSNSRLTRNRLSLVKLRLAVGESTGGAHYLFNSFRWSSGLWSCWPPPPSSWKRLVPFSSRRTDLSDRWDHQHRSPIGGQRSLWDKQV